MKSKVTQKKRVRKPGSAVKLFRLGRIYSAFGKDALLVAHALKIPFFSKKSQGKFIHHTSFASAHLEVFSAVLQASDCSVSVFELVHERSVCHEQ